MFTLYYRPTCPYCINVLNAAEMNNVRLKLKDISRDSQAETELVSLGGKRQVPFLVDTEHNVSMYESADIITYISEHNKTHN